MRAADLREAAQLGTRLLGELRPHQAKRKDRTPEAVTEAALLRDRLWTLLVERHDRARRAAMWLYGQNPDAQVPSLMANAAKKKVPPKKPAAAPSAEPEATEPAEA